MVHFCTISMNILYQQFHWKCLVQIVKGSRFSTWAYRPIGHLYPLTYGPMSYRTIDLLVLAIMRHFLLNLKVRNRHSSTFSKKITNQGSILVIFFNINLLCKLDHFITMQQNWFYIKWSSLLKSKSKLTPKKFYEIDPSWNVFRCVISLLGCIDLPLAIHKERIIVKNESLGWGEPNIG